jgi:PKD repeat protein
VLLHKTNLYLYTMFRLAFLLLLVSHHSFAQVNLSKGLTAWYPFNGNANDESGNGNNPSTVKVTYTTDRSGNANAACLFNGSSNYIRIPNSPSFNFKKGFSISAWVMVKGFYSGPCHGNRIIMKGYTDYLDGNYMLTFDDNYGTRGSNCNTTYPDKNRQSFYAAAATPVAENFITPGKWYLLTYTYDGYLAQLYVDCKLQAKGVLYNNNFSSPDDVFFGKMNNPQFPYWFNGILDEVRFYNRPLNREEIKALCDDKEIKNKPEIICEGANIVSAKFDYSITNCTTTAFNLSTTKTKDLSSIKWFFGDGNTSGKIAPAHTYKKYGTYKVKVITTSKTGCTDTVTRQLQLQELQADFTMTENGSPGEMLFKVKNNKAAYAWHFDEENIIKNESVVNKQYLQSGDYAVALYAKNNNGCTDTVRKNIRIALPAPITAIVNTTPEEITPPPLPVATTPLEKRNKDVLRTISLEQDSIGIALYDNGIIDGDSITLLFNNEIVVTHQLLKSTPLKMWLKIDPSKASNELVMYAENLGTIPPNTALLLITDGDKKYEVNISSSKASNGTVSFIPKRIVITAQ